MISVIVPAHNEETVIAGCLSAILTGVRPGEIEVIVACNGCTDRTVQIVRSFGESVQCVDIESASKVAALNAGDARAVGFPRFYVDADVVLDLASIRCMAEVLSRGDALMATPELRLDLRRSSWPVRAFYRVWTNLPYNCCDGRVGTGVYALSREGRSRFSRFPEIINDDGFVRFLFSPVERTTVPLACSVVSAPRTLRAVVRAKTRVRIGLHQLQNSGLAPPRSARDVGRSLTVTILTKPRLWPSLPIYFSVCAYTRFRASQLSDGMSQSAWRRDDSRSAPRQY